MTLKDWHLLPLQSVCAVNPKLGDDVPQPDTLVSFVPMAAVAEQGGGIIQAETRPYSEVAKGYTYFREKDVLFAKITPCMENGKITIARGLANGIGFGSTEFHVIRCGPDVIPEWVFAFVSQPAFRAAAKESFTGTAGQQRVPADFVKNSAIPLPPLPEQHRLVRLLDEADALRRLRARADERMADFIPALFHEMFGDPARNEKRWTIKAIKDVGTVTTGSTPPTRISAYYGNEIEWIKSDNINTPSHILTRAAVGLSAEGKKAGRVVPAGSILVTCIAGSSSTIGNAAITDREVAFNQQINAITPNPNINTNFLYAQILALKPVIKGASSGGMKGIVSKSKFETIPVIVPPPQIQEEFGNRFVETLGLLEQQAQSKARLGALFESMLARAFAGEL